MKHSTKTVELIQFKALGPMDGEPEGTFEALVAVFGNVDKMGDRIDGKAFDDSLEQWRSKAVENGVRIPVIFQHDWSNPMSYIGSADPNDVRVVPGRGLYAKGQIEHMETNPVAKQVYLLMKSGVITEWSFGYSVPRGGQKKAKDGANDLLRLNIFEFGPCLRGVNPVTETLAVKSALEAEARLKSYVDVDVEGSFEQTQDALRNALREQYPAPPNDLGQWRSVTIVATTSDTVTYQICSSGEDDDQMFAADYTIDENGEAQLGEPREVQARIVPKAVKEDDVLKKAFELAAAQHPDGIPSNVTAAIINDPEAWIAEQGKADQDLRAKAWDGAATDYDDAQYAKACVLDRAIGDESFKDATAKERYGLPVAKPGQDAATDPDVDGVHAAAQRLSGVKASAEAVRTAAVRLQRAYDKIGEDEGVDEAAKASVGALAKADELVFEQGTWRGEQSLEHLAADNAKAASALERVMYEQSIDASESELAASGVTADKLEVQFLDDQLTDQLLNI